MNRHSKKGFMVFVTLVIIISGFEILAGDVGAQPPPTLTLVKDINPGPNSSDPLNFIVDNSTSTVYFSATDATHGTELWRSDGTASGTVMVKDINPGSNDSIRFGLQGVVLNLTLFFTADDGVHGGELWKTDGTEAGTIMVKDIWSVDERGSWPESFTVYDSKVYFIVYIPTSGYELWRSDGTSVGTEKAVDNTKLGDGWHPVHLIWSQGSFLYFIADDKTHGHGLWRTDGTQAGTIMLNYIGPGANWETDYQQVIKALGSLLFTVNYESWGTDNQLWVTDGTPEGTTLLKHFQSSESGHWIVPLNEMSENLLFLADDGTHGYELWKTDGTPEGTVLVKDINAGAGGAFQIWPDDQLGPYDFGANFGVSYRTGILPYYRYIDSNSSVYFIADNGTAGWDQDRTHYTPMQIWKTDGTSSGTVKVTDFGVDTPEPYSPIPVGDTLYFWRDYNLWKIVKPGDPAVLVYTFKIDNEVSSMGGMQVAVDRIIGSDLLIVRWRPDLTTEDPMDYYEELWTTDGTTDGTRLLVPSSVGTDVTLSSYAAVLNDALLFAAQVGVQNSAEGLGAELYKYPNAAPVAILPSSYIGQEGTPIQFNAGASKDDLGIVTYEWDWNDDGIYDETTTTPLAAHTWADDFSGIVRLRVTDGYGLTGETTTTVTVRNVAPMASIDSVKSPYPSIFVGDPVTFYGSFKDPGINDTHSIAWYFGDGTAVPGTLTPTHAYSVTGKFIVTLEVKDDDGGVGYGTAIVTVTNVIEAMADLTKTVENLNIDAGLKSNLLSKLKEAQRLLTQGKMTGAAGKLGAFINAVKAQAGKKLSAEQAAGLVAKAQAIINHLS